MQIVDAATIDFPAARTLAGRRGTASGLQSFIWDYRASIDLIKKFVDAPSLTARPSSRTASPVGYAFYVLEEHKGSGRRTFRLPELCSTGI